MSDGNIAFKNGDGILHIVLTAPPRLSYIRLADSLVFYFGLSFSSPAFSFHPNRELLKNL